MHTFAQSKMSFFFNASEVWINVAPSIPRTFSHPELRGISDSALECWWSMLKVMMISCRCCWLQLEAPISNCGSGIIWSGCPFSLKNYGRFARVKSTHGQLPVPMPTIATSGGVPQLASLPYIFIHIRSILCVTSTTITHKWYKIAGRRAASQAKCAIMYTTHHTIWQRRAEEGEQPAGELWSETKHSVVVCFNFRS